MKYFNVTHRMVSFITVFMMIAGVSVITNVAGSQSAKAYQPCSRWSPSWCAEIYHAKDAGYYNPFTIKCQGRSGVYYTLQGMSSNDARSGCDVGQIYVHYNEQIACWNGYFYAVKWDSRGWHDVHNGYYRCVAQRD